jgi:hypothetical protein
MHPPGNISPSRYRDEDKDESPYFHLGIFARSIVVNQQLALSIGHHAPCATCLATVFTKPLIGLLAFESLLVDRFVSILSVSPKIDFDSVFVFSRLD